MEDLFFGDDISLPWSDVVMLDTAVRDITSCSYGSSSQNHSEMLVVVYIMM